jgi:hypothetical protein
VTLGPVRGVRVAGMVVSGGVGATPGPGRPLATAKDRPDHPGGAGEAGTDALSQQW